jgi:hypothetical protein
MDSHTFADPRKLKGSLYVDMTALRKYVHLIVQKEGLQGFSPDCVEFLALLLEERIRDLLDRLAWISRQKTVLRPRDLQLSEADGDLLCTASYASAPSLTNPLTFQDIQLLFDSDPLLPRTLLHLLRHPPS